MIIAWKVKKCTDHFVANELRCKMKYLVWKDEFRWRSNNNENQKQTFKDTSFYVD